MKPNSGIAVLDIGALIAGSMLYIYHTREETHSPAAVSAVEKKVPARKSDTERKPAAAPRVAVGADADRMASVPERYQLPGVERVRTARNFKEWLAQFSETEQAAITDFDKHHFGIFSTVTSPQQVAWMAERGYPMPEDVIAVANLADDQLRSLSSQGNDKAGFLLHEREVAAIEAKIDASTRNGESKEAILRSDQTLAIERSRIRDAVQTLYVTSESPYKGYAMAQDASRLNYPGERSATIIAGLLWASQYGDSRASTDAMYAFFKGDAQIQSQQLAALKMLAAVGFDQRRLNCYTSFPNTRIPEKAWNN